MKIDANNKKRKPIRLKDYDYSQNGAYFVTICTNNRELLFGDVGADSVSARMVDDVFNGIMSQYDNVYCPKYVVMPNHFHAIIVIEDRADMESAPTVNLIKIIQEFKRYTTVEYIKLVKSGKIEPFKDKVW